MTDYRALQAQAEAKMAKADRIRQTAAAAGRKITDKEESELGALDLEIAQIEIMAGSLREIESRELADIAKNGTIVSGGTFAGCAGAEIADFYNALKPGGIRDAMSTGGDAGLILPEPLHASLLEKARLADPLLAEATMFDLTGGNSADLQLPYKATAGAVAHATELGARSEKATPTFTSRQLTCFEIYSDQRASQQTADSLPNFESWMVESVVGDLLEQFSADLAMGDGNGKAKGLFASSDVFTSVASGSNNVLTNAQFLTTFFALPEKYRRSAAWVCNSATLATIAAMAHPATANQTLATQNPISGEWSIFGTPVKICDSAPSHR